MNKHEEYKVSDRGVWFLSIPEGTIIKDERLVINALDEARKRKTKIPHEKAKEMLFAK